MKGVAMQTTATRRLRASDEMAFNEMLPPWLWPITTNFKLGFLCSLSPDLAGAFQQL
jgi:hypothetical protein